MRNTCNKSPQRHQQNKTPDQEEAQQQKQKNTGAKGRKAESAREKTEQQQRRANKRRTNGPNRNSKNKRQQKAEKRRKKNDSGNKRQMAVSKTPTIQGTQRKSGAEAQNDNEGSGVSGNGVWQTRKPYNRARCKESGKTVNKKRPEAKDQTGTRNAQQNHGI